MQIRGRGVFLGLLKWNFAVMGARSGVPLITYPRPPLRKLSSKKGGLESPSRTRGLRVCRCPYLNYLSRGIRTNPLPDSACWDFCSRALARLGEQCFYSDRTLCLGFHSPSGAREGLENILLSSSLCVKKRITDSSRRRLLSTTCIASGSATNCIEK